MNDSSMPNAKYCPQCQRLCPITAPVCQGCGRQFRTKFAAPKSSRAARPPRPPRPSLRARLQALPETFRVWAEMHHSQIDAAKGPVGWSAIVLVGLLLLLHPLGDTSHSPASSVSSTQSAAPKVAVRPTPKNGEKKPAKKMAERP